MTTGNMCGKFGEVRHLVSEICLCRDTHVDSAYIHTDRQTDRQTDRHAHHNILLPYQ